MAISARILADSVGPSGKRITTMEWTYPRSIHSEIMTHRMLSKNAASSRAIPTMTLIERVTNDPWIPEHIGQNQRGMQAGEQLPADRLAEAKRIWLCARDAAVTYARILADLGVHKQVVNRVIEPYMWITIIVTATEWENVWALRDHPDAEPHFQELARRARAARDANMPRYLAEGDWHIPMITWDDEVAHSTEELLKLSVGRCARVSYLTHDGKREPAKDLELHDRILGHRPMHASPAEHQAQALATPERVGNLVGWRSYRMTLHNEHTPG